MVDGWWLILRRLGRGWTPGTSENELGNYEHDSTPVFDDLPGRIICVLAFHSSPPILRLAFSKIYHLA